MCGGGGGGGGSLCEAPTKPPHNCDKLLQSLGQELLHVLKCSKCYTPVFMWLPLLYCCGYVIFMKVVCQTKCCCVPQLPCSSSTCVTSQMWSVPSMKPCHRQKLIS